MAGRLRDPYVNVGTVDVNGNCVVPIVHNATERVWEIQQITVNYSSPGDLPTLQITVNGEVYSGGAVMLPSQGKNGQGGLGQTFGGLPYLYMENHDRVQVEVGNGSLGTTVTVHVQFREITYDDDALTGYY